MKVTVNYKFKKPDYTDVADVKTINDNMDSVDALIASLRDAVTLAQKTADLIYGKCPFTHYKIFTANGSWTCPADIRKVAVWIADGGQGGGSAVARGDIDGTSSNYICSMAPHGSSGKWGIGYNINVTPGKAYPITVGQGGTAGIQPDKPDTGAGSYTIGEAGGLSSAFGLSTSNQDVYLGIYQSDGGLVAYKGKSASDWKDAFGKSVSIGSRDVTLNGVLSCDYMIALKLAISEYIGNGGAGAVAKTVESMVDPSELTAPIYATGKNGLPGAVIIFY